MLEALYFPDRKSWYNLVTLTPSMCLTVSRDTKFYSSVSFRLYIEKTKVKT